jgi:hypothetical protein
VNSTHFEMLREPAVQVIAEQLKSALDPIERDESFHARVNGNESMKTCA